MARRRSRRSYVVELALVAAGLIAILLFLALGGPQAVGEWLAGQMQFGN